MLFSVFATAQTQVGHLPSLQVNEDGSVVFRYYDTTAYSVKLHCDCKLRREIKEMLSESYHSIRMRKDSDGVWTYTTPPLASEVYTYQFEVDGRTFPDPLNADSVRVRRSRMSVFIVDGNSQTHLYFGDTLLGRMDTVEFQRGEGQKTRRIIVYTPPQYADNQDCYPVLYLLHGLNGNEVSWQERGRAVNILENLILQQKAKPMILVMPDANPECLVSNKEEVGLFQNIMLFPAWNKLEFEKSYKEMDEFLSTRYRFSMKKGSRAVAGLSAGAKQSCNLANMYDSTFSSVGLFSPVVSRKQLPDNNFAHYWIGGGTRDFFHHRINKFRKKLQRHHVLYTMYNTKGGHTWRNWRVYFTEYVQTLFWRN